MVVLGEGAVSNERGTPVAPEGSPLKIGDEDMGDSRPLTPNAQSKWRQAGSPRPWPFDGPPPVKVEGFVTCCPHTLT